MELKIPTRQQLQRAYERDLMAAFPAAELKPLRSMLASWERGEYRPWCLFDGGEIVGEAFVWEHVSGFALFDYLCVAPARRNGGLGSALVQKLVEAERGKVLFGEAEIPDYAPDPAMAERRLAFYRRGGAKQADYDTCAFGVPYRTLYWAAGDADEKAMCAAHAATYRSGMPEAAYERYIQIPWEPSMGVPEKTAWIGWEKP